MEYDHKEVNQDVNEIEFDRAFSRFLAEEKCEMVSETLYQLIRSAFTAGWKAALGSDIGKAMNVEDRKS